MVNETITAVRKALQAGQTTKRELARVAGLHRNTLLGCERSEWDPRSSTLRALETALRSISQ